MKQDVILIEPPQIPFTHKIDFYRRYILNSKMAKCGSCNSEGHKSTSKKCPNYVAKPRVKKEKVKIEKNTITLKAQDILLFTESPKGKGRDPNDSSNKIREKILVETVRGNTEQFTNDPVHKEAWSAFIKATKDAVKEVAKYINIDSYDKIEVESKGGRSKNIDLLLTFFIHGKEPIKISLEFKFNATCIKNIPEWFNPAANKDFHNTYYAEFYYDNYLVQLRDIYKIKVPLPSKEDYVKYIHSDTPKGEFLIALDAADRLDSPTRKKKATNGPLLKLANDLYIQSSLGFLNKVKDQTKLDVITQEFQRANNDKVFLLYCSGKFYLDSISPDELIAKSVVEIKNDNTLVIQTAEENTQHHMLLRWKNHNGILFPAWQVKLVRSNK